MLKIKRVYEPAAKADGTRVLIDRLWPRGLSKRAARVDVWMKEIAPSPALRKWFGHDPAKWSEFRRRYRRELAKNAAALEPLRRLAARRRTTLIYAAREERYNDAVVLLEYLAGGK